MRQTQMRSLVFTNPVYSGRSRLLLLILALGAIWLYVYEEGKDVLDNWEDDTYFSSW